MIELRSYQKECVERVINAFKNGSKFEFIILPTGAGKTLVFSSIIHELQKKHGLNALVIAHREELISQAADKYRMINPDAIVGKVGSGVHEYGCEVTVASIQTISRPEHLEKIQSIKYGIVIIDEFHHSAASGYQKVLEALPDAFVLGMTATPDRLDKKDITKGKQPIFSKNIIEMVQEGYLCNFKAIAIQTNISLDKVNTSMGDYNEGELNDAVNTSIRNNLIVQKYKEYANGKKAITFCVSVAHAEALAQAFNDNGIPSAVVEGNTPSEKRKSILHNHSIGKLTNVTNVNVLSEGYDEPRVECIIMARPTQSRSLYVQQFGRGLRLAPGKKECILLDITDNCLNHRLSPQNLRKAIGKHLNDQETLLEALEREKLESEEREIQVRKLKEKRLQDIQIDLFETLEWKELPNGIFLLEVGIEKHRIALTPSTNNPDLYYVALKRAPLFEFQKLTNNPLPIDWAQQEAEKAARKIAAEPRGIALVDRNSPWRQKPISENQIKFMKGKKIPFTLEMTQGQAADLIDAHQTKKEREKAAKKRKQEANA